MEQTLDYSAVVMRISRQDGEAVTSLYNLLQGFRKRLVRQLGLADGEEGFHSGFVALLDLINAGRIGEPDKLIGIASTIFHRQYCQAIKQRVKDRVRQVPISPLLPERGESYDPFDHALREERVERMRRALSELPEKSKEILIRFYLNGESKEQICTTMDLTENQFRLNKSRAKARLLAAVSRKPLPSAFACAGVS
jgi:RNA polymerase sigma factor (sigma-70 family)